MHLHIISDVELDGPSGFLSGSALFAFDEATGSNARHQDVPVQVCELVYFMIGGLLLTRSQVCDAVGNATVLAWEQGITDMRADGAQWPDFQFNAIAAE
jgi:hypothetical protein